MIAPHIKKINYQNNIQINSDFLLRNHLSSMKFKIFIEDS